jgi:hypothetical protein
MLRYQSTHVSLLKSDNRKYIQTTPTPDAGADPINTLHCTKNWSLLRIPNPNKTSSQFVRPSKLPNRTQEVRGRV